MIVNIALSILTRDARNTDWFDTKNAVQQIKKAFYDNMSIQNLGRQAVFGFWEIFAKDPLFFSAAGFLTVESFHCEIGVIIFVALYVMLIGPLIEEILFRGFLQDKIRDLQVLLFHEKADVGERKLIRSFIQGLAFGACHYHPAQSFFNLFFVPQAFLFGFSCGATKEEERNLWSTLTTHSRGNAIVYTRLAITSQLWKLNHWTGPLVKVTITPDFLKGFGYYFPRILGK